jgi:signal transduction histidine kinase/ActR/RegA family two-component response regulator
VSNRHPLLQRQVQQAAGPDGQVNLERLLDMVSATYRAEEEASRERASAAAEVKAGEAALVEARDVAEAANRAKSEFLAAMSHEIRTPLNGVLGMAAALETTQLSELQRRMIGVINESGQTLMALLSDILDLSKIEAGAMELEVTPFEMAGCAQAVTSLFEESAKAKGIGFALHVAPEAAGVFEGDPTRIRQILQNLISNAMKFTSEGRVDVRVGAGALEQGRRSVMVEVVDTGVGISAEAQARLFSKFVQADTSTNRKYGGTGLGLAICRELVTAMGGEIGVESEEGRGARFWVRLPLAVGEASAPEAVSQTSAEVEEDRPLRILAAEDNPTNQFVLKAILGQKGLEATFVENGRLALEAVQAKDFDVILMDLHMPEMDGITATQAIRALAGEKGAIPVVAVTAEAMPEQVRKCLAAGMDAHVAKPIRPDVLYAVIEEVLTRTAGARMMA